ARIARLFHLFFAGSAPHRHLHSFPTRRSSDLSPIWPTATSAWRLAIRAISTRPSRAPRMPITVSPSATTSQRKVPVASSTCWRRSEEHTSELQSRENLVCRLLLEKKKKKKTHK